MRIRNDVKETSHAFILRFVLFSVLPILVFIGLSNEANAARFFFESPAHEVGIGQRIEITLLLDSEGETINALEGRINVPNFMRVEEVRDGNSLISFWSERPEVQDGQIIFSGVTPGGWRGTTAHIFSFITETTDEGSGAFTFQDTQVLLHDGEGTKTITKGESLILRVDSAIALEEFVFDEDDREPPEPFTPLLTQDPDIFDGDYMLVFAAQDKSSGIDHYEIQETKKRLTDESRGIWERAESPYRIKDQSLRSFVYVRAVDRAGNVRISLWEPLKAPSRKPISAYVGLAIVLAFVGILIFMRRRKVKHETTRIRT